ncbi:MAG TPA: AMP-binding protein, partial [Myxococcales bacterium]|nr:AMP-binding protein [Myxococcales bacterium]
MSRQRATLREVLEAHRESEAGISFIGSGGQSSFLSYANLHQEALLTLHGLQRRGVQPDDELVIYTGDLRDFLQAFWACVLGRIKAVPLTVATETRLAEKLLNVWSVLPRPWLYTSGRLLDELGAYARKLEREEELGRIRAAALTSETLERSGDAALPAVRESDVAVVQFSSGSTGSPKGVCITHRNAMSNVRAILDRIAPPPARMDRTLSWMPLTHDLGLVGGHLTPLVEGWPQHLMSPQLFVQRPALWLEHMARHRVTVTASPNFGYRHLLKYGRLDGGERFDLSCLRLILNGAEPISPELCAAFLDRMASYGLPRTAMRPVYGLAEATLAVCIPGPEDPFRAVTVDRRSLRVGQPALPVPEGPDAASFVEVGPPLVPDSVRIAGDGGQPLEEGRVGHIQIRGDNVTAGYYGDPQATARAVTPDGWLETGDLGFFRGGRLVVTGRLKDVIFFQGQNYYAHDVERIVEELGSVDPRRIAAAGVFNPQLQADELVVFVALRQPLEQLAATAHQVIRHLARRLGHAARVVPVPRIPVTTSGKAQRYLLREAYLAGEYDPAARELQAALDRLQAGDQPGAFQDETERRIAAIAAEVLEVPAVQRADDFFDLGLDSINALRLADRLSVELGLEVSTGAIHDFSSAAGLRRHLASLRDGAPGPAAGGEGRQETLEPARVEALVARAISAHRAFHRHLAGGPVRGEFAVGPVQTRHLRRGNVYPQVFDLEVRGEPGPGGVVIALRDFVRQQQLLRCELARGAGGYVFRERGGAAGQGDLPVPSLDLSDLAPASQDQAREAISAGLEAELVSGAPEGPLYALVALRLDERTSRVLFLVSHLVSDNSSGRILRRFLLAAPEREGAPPAVLPYRHFLEHFVAPSAAAAPRFARTPLFQELQAAVDQFRARHGGPDAPGAPLSEMVSIKVRHHFPSAERSG